MTTLSNLKKNTADINRLNAAVDKLNTPAAKESYEDTRFWKPDVDKSGNGYAVIRFLPAPAIDGDDALPWARYWDHGFQGPTGKWYIEKSRTTLGEKDPVSEYNTELWNANDSDTSPEKTKARDQKRRLHYVSNILVVTDPKHPENEGKIFLYQYGKKIFDKISASMHPEFDDEKAVNPFDPWEGANFKLKIRKVAGYRNYDESKFDASKALGTDQEIEKIWKSEYSLKEFTDPKTFKSYEELAKKLEEVIPGSTKGVGVVSKNETITDNPTLNESFKKHIKEAKQELESVDKVTIDTDGDDELDYFKALADED